MVVIVFSKIYKIAVEKMPINFSDVALQFLAEWELETLDIERGVRAKVIEILDPFFTCYEEVNLVTRSGSNVRTDVLAISFENCSKPVVFAIEVKSHANDDPGKFKDAVFQASRYVQASVAPKARTDLLGLKIDAALVFPAPNYPVGMEFRQKMMDVNIF
jgi:hypothetical protein